MGTPMPPQHRWTIFALALAMGMAFAGGVWTLTLSPLQQRAAASNASTAPATAEHVSAAPPHRLRLGPTVSGGSVVAEASGTTWVLGPGTLSTVTDGVATVIARGSWSDHALLAPSNEGGLWIASGPFLWMVSSTGSIGKRLSPSVGAISAVLATDGRTWVAGSSGMLAWIDPYTANTIQSYYLGSGNYQLAATSGYVFVATTEPTQAPVVRLDPAAGGAVPVPGAQAAPIAAGDGRLWWASAGRIQCVDARTLRPCGQLRLGRATMLGVATPMAIAAHRDALWVVYAATRGPEVSLFDPQSRRPIAGPIAVPGSSGATVAVDHTTAWIGMRDAGTVTAVERN